MVISKNFTTSRISPEIVECLKDSPDQLKAAELAIQNNFAVITGGPGTGKTYLLVAILVNLLKENPSLKISLVAPTGKAAQRMTESIQANIDLFPLTKEENKFSQKCFNNSSITQTSSTFNSF